MTPIAHGTPSRGAARHTLLGRASWLAAPALSLLTLLFTGCSANFNPELTGADPSSAVGSLKGNIHGGQAPIYGAAIYVMQTGLSGYPVQVNVGPTFIYASANTSLITSGSGVFTGTVNGTSHGTYVLTDINGNFTIPGFTCTPGAGVYIYSVGGEPIYGTPNNAATEMAAMGICPAGGAAALATSVPFVNVNEVSTVAMAYALGGFTEAGYDATHISSSSTNTTGLANAFGTAATLYSVGTNNGANQYISGQSSTTQITYQTINSLADILSDCINSNGSTSSSTTPCYILFQNATSNGVSGGGTVPTDTASAIINISHFPQSNLSALYALTSNSYAPYSPTWGATVPSNFTIGIWYYNLPNSAFTNVSGISIDSAGYVYNTSPISASGTGISGLTKFSPYSGVVGTTASGGNSSLITLDQSNNVFVDSGSSITEYAASTTSLFGASKGTYTLTGSNTLGQMSIGINNNIFVSVSNGSVINVPLSSGTYNLNSPSQTYGPTGLTQASVVSTQNTAGQVWIQDYANNYIDYVASGSSLTKDTFATTSDLSDGMALQLHGNPVVSSYNGNAIYDYDFPSTRITGGGLNSPTVPAVDGTQTFWLPNQGACTISAYSKFGVYNYSIGWEYSNGLNIPFCSQNSNNIGGSQSAAVDPSGNLWVGMSLPSTTVNGTTGLNLQNGGIFEFVGIAGPTKQPLSLQGAASYTSNYDTRP